MNSVRSSSTSTDTTESRKEGIGRPLHLVQKFNGSMGAE